MKAMGESDDGRRSVWRDNVWRGARVHAGRDLRIVLIGQRLIQLNAKTGATPKCADRMSALEG